MTKRHASCCCGQLRLACEGDPVRISICHCLACQQRTGIGTQARYRREQVSAIEGRVTEYTRVGDSGQPIIFHFCPVCGSTVYWRLAQEPDVIAVAVGAFADPDFPQPRRSIYEKRRHRWALAAGELEMEHQ
jgi:hypothetical protein